MGVWYWLVNYTKREQVMFTHIGASTKFELAYNPASSAITTWYLLENIGDRISFVSDTYDDWPFLVGSRDDLSSYQDVTDQVAKALLENGILSDHGMVFVDEDDPDHIYIRDLRTTWDG